MATQTYIYSISADLPSGVHVGNLHNDIVNAGLDQTLLGVSTDDDVLRIEFVAALGAASKAVIDGATAGPAGGLLASHDSTLPQPGSVSNGGYVESDSESTTASTSYQAKSTLITAALTGVYELRWYCDYGNDDEEGTAVRLHNLTDGVTYGEATMDGPSIEGGGSPDWRLSHSGFKQITFAGVPKTFQIQYRDMDSDKGGTAYAWNARISLQKVVN